MASFWTWWQHIPAQFSPIAFSIAGIPVYWYALFFLGGAGIVYFFAGREYFRAQIFTKAQYQDFAFGIFVSMLFGAKLGFLLLYWWPFVLSDRGAILPFSQTGSLGLPGMSFFGGVVGVGLFLWWYSRKHQKNFWVLTDILALFVPLALFCGRLGNFSHHELLGRITDKPWGMYSIGESILRHPSVLYAAFLEGILLFGILFVLRKQNTHTKFGTGMLTVLFCVGYGVLRFTSEFFREPDVQIGYVGILTLNQWFALAIAVLSAVFLTVKNQKNTV